MTDALRDRLPRVLRPPKAPGRRSWAWRVLVPVVCLTAGFGFAASARDARGTDLRPPGTVDLVDTVRTAETQVRAETRTVAGLQTELAAARAAVGRGDAGVARVQGSVTPLLAPGGLTAARGDGITVVLDDAPESAETTGVDPNELVVHQSDLQAVVNALWAGGAQAMTISGQRVVATSAVRCVGNTLLLNGEVFSPPFRVAAIGPYRTMTRELDTSPGVALFVQAAGYYGLGYTVESSADLHLPAYRGSVGLVHARVAR